MNEANWKFFLFWTNGFVVKLFSWSMVKSIKYFSVHHSYQLADNEEPTSIISCQLGSEPSSYYVVGTAFVYPEETEPKQGRILIFRYAESKISLSAS